MAAVRPTLAVVIPAFNEEDNIVEVISSWSAVLRRTGVPSLLIVVDDGSTDSTIHRASAAIFQDDPAILLTKTNAGHGPTLQYGYRYALDLGCEWVFQTDSDLQTVPDDFWKLWELRAHFDFLVGSREKREDGVSRRIVSLVLKLVILGIFHMNIKDANSPFRLMRAGVLRESLNKLPTDCFLANVFVIVSAVGSGARIQWIPISFLQRRAGTSFVNVKRLFSIGIRVIREMQAFRGQLSC